jgi:hypothetical protein
MYNHRRTSDGQCGDDSRSSIDWRDDCHITSTEVSVSCIVEVVVEVEKLAIIDVTFFI